MVKLKDTVTVAACQLELVTESARGREENLERAIKLMEEAVEKKADIICLPELFIGAGTVEAIPGPTSNVLCDFAKENRVYIVPNIYERKEGKKYSSIPFIDRNGDIIGIYRKVQLFPWEEKFSGCTPGSTLDVYDTDFGKVGLMICHDLMLPEISRILTLKGAEVLFVPGRMPGPFLVPWSIFCRVRAIENNAFLVSAGGAKAHTVGTLIVAPKLLDDVVVQANSEEQVVTATLDLKWLRESRKDSPLYSVTSTAEIKEYLPKLDSHSFLRDRRPDLYKKYER